MRNYPTDDYDWAFLKRMKPPKWMVDLLKLNPEYNAWGPHEDYMMGSGSWTEPIFKEWDDFASEFSLDDLNEVFSFYFQVARAQKQCDECESSGYNPATHVISESFYNHSGAYEEAWCDKITEDEAQALIAQGRRPHGSTAEQINAEQHKGGIFHMHDAINRFILIEARARRLGVWGYCEKCEGHSSVFTAEECHVNLVLWWCHPRKGCSRGVEVKVTREDQLPAVFAFLTSAAERNANRFQKVVEAHGARGQVLLPDDGRSRLLH